jgi:hypothetical protein
MHLKNDSKPAMGRLQGLFNAALERCNQVWKPGFRMHLFQQPSDVAELYHHLTILTSRTRQDQREL